MTLQMVFTSKHFVTNVTAETSEFVIGNLVHSRLIQIVIVAALIRVVVGKYFVGYNPMFSVHICD